jgi:hypothetical protein
MATAAQKSLAARITKHNPYNQQVTEAMGHLATMRACVEKMVQEQRQVQALRRMVDCTFVGADSDASLQFNPAGTYAVFQVPKNMSWKCMRVAVASVANDIVYIYRGAPNPQNLVERAQCLADGFYVDSFSNDLYMAPGTLVICQSSLAAQFHVNLEIERNVPYMQGIPADDLLEDELVQTPHDNEGADRDFHSIDIVEPEVARHENTTGEPPDENPHESYEQHAERQLLPDPNAHLPGAHV